MTQYFRAFGPGFLEWHPGTFKVRRSPTSKKQSPRRQDSTPSAPMSALRLDVGSLAKPLMASERQQTTGIYFWRATVGFAGSLAGRPRDFAIMRHANTATAEPSRSKQTSWRVRCSAAAPTSLARLASIIGQIFVFVLVFPTRLSLFAIGRCRLLQKMCFALFGFGV